MGKFFTPTLMSRPKLLQFKLENFDIQKEDDKSTERQEDIKKAKDTIKGFLERSGKGSYDSDYKMFFGGARTEDEFECSCGQKIKYDWRYVEYHEHDFVVECGLMFHIIDNHKESIKGVVEKLDHLNASEKIG